MMLLVLVIVALAVMFYFRRSRQPETFTSQEIFDKVQKAPIVTRTINGAQAFVKSAMGEKFDVAANTMSAGYMKPAVLDL